MEISDKHDILSFHGLYKITRSGEVYSVRGSKFLKQAIDRYGYPKVVLTAGGKSYYRTVHRLVAETRHDVAMVYRCKISRSANRS